MGLETANYVADLVATNPTTNDPVAQGDDQIRLLKAVLKASFPLVTGALNATMVPFTPTGNLAATTVAAALAELDSEKYSVGGALGTPASGNLANCTFPTLNQNTTGNAATASSASAIADGAVSTSAKIAANVVTTAKLAREGTAGQVLYSNGPGADPSYGTPPAAGVTSVGGNTGAVTNAQVAAAALAGGGVAATSHTHPYVSTDCVGAVGSFFVKWDIGETPNYAVGSSYSGSALGAPVAYSTAGTWRCVSMSTKSSTEWIPIFQRIA